MAIGVPRKRANAASRPRTIATADGPDFRLEYPGKLATSIVLAEPPAIVERLWDGALPGRPSANRLYFGENAAILASLLDDPMVAGQVRLIYIDPPFATQSVFHSRNQQHAYEDTLSGCDFIEFLRARLLLLRELLADDGSIYVHLDDKMVFQAKMIMDEIFGDKRFMNCIVRKKCNPKNYTRKKYGNVADFVLFYTKGEEYVWNRPVEPWTEERAKEYQYVEPETGRRFMKVPVHAPGVRHGETGKPWRGMLPPPGKHWQFPPATLEDMDRRGEIYWSPNGNPRRKVYLDQSDGIGVQDLWLDFRDAHNQNICITGYPTEKNPGLLRRIVETSSNPGDLVLDCFSGSGTTLAVASELGRRWIGIDKSPEAIATTLRRFRHGLAPMGDFVTPQKKSGNGQSAQGRLFDDPVPGIEAPAQSPSGDHRPISDFQLLAEAGLVEKGLVLVAEWQAAT